MIARKYEHVYVKMRIDNNHEFFQECKLKLHTDAQIYIAYRLRKRWKKKNKKKKLQQDKNTKNNSKVKGYIDGKKKHVENTTSYRRMN